MGRREGSKWKEVMKADGRRLGGGACAQPSLFIQFSHHVISATFAISDAALLLVMHYMSL